METTMRLLDRITPALLQDLQNSFAESMGTTMVFTDPQGTPITTPSRRSAPQHSHEPEQPAAHGAGLFSPPEVCPVAVMIFTEEACLGQWIIGDAPPQTVQPDICSLIFMPLEADQEIVGFLGIAPGIMHHWPPEMLSHLWRLSKVLARKLEPTTTRNSWTIPSRFESVYGSGEIHPRFTV